MPLIRRLPKRGFNNAAFKVSYAPVNLGELEKLDASGLVDEKSLRAAGLVNGTWHGVKILGGGSLTKKLTLKVDAISASAREQIEKAGGSIELIAAKVYPARNSAKKLAKTSCRPKSPLRNPNRPIEEFVLAAPILETTGFDKLRMIA